MIPKAFGHVANAAGRDGQECYFLLLASVAVLQRSKVRESAPAGTLDPRPSPLLLLLLFLPRLSVQTADRALSQEEM